MVGSSSRELPNGGYLGRQPHDEESRKRFVISVAAELAGMHAQTLRTYDRLGLVRPERTQGGGRRYSQRDINHLRKIQKLSQDDGINLAGIKRILELARHVESLEDKVLELNREIAALRASRGTAVLATGPSRAVELWIPAHRRKTRTLH